jgi:hypothetical protein
MREMPILRAFLRVFYPDLRVEQTGNKASILANGEHIGGRPGASVASESNPAHKLGGSENLRIAHTHPAGDRAAMTDQELAHYIEQRGEKLIADARRAGLTDTDEITRYMRDHLDVYETADEVRDHPNWRKVVQQLRAKLNAN